LKLGEDEFGPDHPTTAQFLNDLAAIYQAQGNYTEAEPLYRRSLEILEMALGPEHPNVPKALDNYAEQLRETGRADEAAEMAARAKSIRAKYE
jgi:tetratricopeptide (TPR) repeat protein